MNTFPGRSFCLMLMGLAAALSASAESDMATSIQRGINAPVDEVIRDASTLHPASMLFLAQRLVETGRRDDALFWFYEGQLRWRARLIDDANANERERFGRLFEQIGPSINIYALCDVDAYAQMIDRVIAWDDAHPDGTPAPARTRTQDGLRGLVTYAREHGNQINRATQCAAPSADPYVGAGGAISGRPNEMVQAYDPARFAPFRVGVTTGDQIIEGLGWPEWWANEGGETTLGYSYNRAFIQGFLDQRLLASFKLDANHVLREINLPRDE